VLLDRISKLASTQSAWLLLLFCGVPRANHLLRTIPPCLVGNLATGHDKQVLQVLETLLALSPGSDTTSLHGIGRELWERQARLPIRLGGCGLRDSSRSSHAAYWASVADCIPVLKDRFPGVAHAMIHTLHQLDHGEPDPSTCLGGASAAGRVLRSSGYEDMPSWGDLYFENISPTPVPDEGDEAVADEKYRGWQCQASRALEQQEYDSLLLAFGSLGTTPNGPLPHRARLRSCAGDHSGEWLVAMPVTPALRFSNEEFHTAFRRRLGLGLGADAGTCEGCRRALDIHGHHRSACPRTARLHARHRYMVSAWRQVLQEAGGHIPARNVERLMRDTHLPIGPSDNRRMDLVVPGLSVARGVPLFCDITCVSPITGSGLARPGATTIDGAMLRNAREENSTTYPEVDESGLGRLYCLSVETFGRWGQDSLELVRDLAREHCRGLPAAVAQAGRTAFLRRWWGLLSVSAQRAAARCILRSAGADLADNALEAPPGFADLPA
jgi:hypothetical protein